MTTPMTTPTKTASTLTVEKAPVAPAKAPAPATETKTCTTATVTEKACTQTPAKLRVVSFVTLDFDGRAIDWLRTDLDAGGCFYEYTGTEPTATITITLADGRTMTDRSKRILVQGSAAHFWDCGA